MKNQEIAAIFNEIADILDIKGANPFRIRAYRKAAQNIENLTEDIAAIAARNDLEAIPGIGKDLAGKIQDFVSTGTLKYYDELKKEVPSGIVTLLAVPGVGPRTAKLIFEHFGVSSVEEVERLAIDHKIQGLPGIKAKTEQNILKGIAILKKGRERLPVGAFLPMAEEIVNILKKKCPVSHISVAGSMRRRRETIKDIDLLVASDKPAKVMEVFTELPAVREIIAHGETKSSIRTIQGISVDLRVVEPKSFGAALCYFTGSKAHNIRVRDLACTPRFKNQ